MPNVFVTDRLYFRKFARSDARGFYELNSDPDVIQYTGDVAFRSIAEAEDFIRKYDHYDRFGYGRWSVFLKETEEYIGFCGLNCQIQSGEVDVGFRFFKRHWGKGYATEAALGTIRYGFREYGLLRIVGRARFDNRASQRVLEKVGMRFEKAFEREGQLWYQYRILRDTES